MPDQSLASEHGSQSVEARSVFSLYGCKGVQYSFTVNARQFQIQQFREATGLGLKQSRWSATCAPKEQASRYHVHFDGSLRPKLRGANFRIYYAAGSVRPAPDETEPFAESIMSWVAPFFTSPVAKADAHVWFERPDDKWKGGFNLPFKVTMSGSAEDTELTINGISLDLPPNPAGAYEGSLKREPGKFITASVKLLRSVDLAQFDIASELAAFDKIVRLWMRETE